MDQDYDMKGAAMQLDQVAQQRYNSPHSELQLSRIRSLSARYEPVAVGSSQRLAHKGLHEEVVGYFQGVIYRQDLPPFTQKLAKNSSHVKHVRQSVTVAGLGTKTFGDVLNVIVDIHAMLGRAVGVSNVQECGMISDHDGLQLVELSNRYFTPRSSSTQTIDEIPLPSCVDPYGYLAQAAGPAGLYHSLENSVEYFVREGSDDEYKYTSVNPAVFSVGDIVEVQASFVVFPVRGGKFKTAMVLRGLTLIDGSFTQARIRNSIMKPAGAPKTLLKRKSAYQEEGMSVTNAKLVRMEIDDSRAAPRRPSDVDEESHTANVDHKSD